MALKELPKATPDRLASRFQSSAHHTPPTSRVRGAQTKQLNLTLSAVDGFDAEVRYCTDACRRRLTQRPGGRGVSRRAVATRQLVRGDQAGRCCTLAEQRLQNHPACQREGHREEDVRRLAHAARRPIGTITEPAASVEVGRSLARADIQGELAEQHPLER